MKIIDVIPCYYQSFYFPSKCLALIDNKPMMWHVYQRVAQANILDDELVSLASEVL